MTRGAPRPGPAAAKSAASCSSVASSSTSNRTATSSKNARTRFFEARSVFFDGARKVAPAATEPSAQGAPSSLFYGRAPQLCRRSAVQRRPAFDHGRAARGVAQRRIGDGALGFEGLRLRVRGQRIGSGGAGGGGVLYALLELDLRLQLGDRVGAIRAGGGRGGGRGGGQEQAGQKADERDDLEHGGGSPTGIQLPDP